MVITVLGILVGVFGVGTIVFGITTLVLYASLKDTDARIRRGK